MRRGRIKLGQRGIQVPLIQRKPFLANGKPIGKILGLKVTWSDFHFSKIILITDLGDLENEIIGR